MSYLDTIGARLVVSSQYIESVEECGCHVEEAVREQGYLGWFANLEECLEAHPQPRLGMSFNNVTTRSVWLYDGVRWVNTTQGNPFALILDEENAGWVRRGVAQSFYYLPQEEGEKQFTFEIEGGGSATISVPITSISEVVFIEWTGETLGYAIYQLDPDVVKNEGGVLKTLSGDVVIDINELLENIVILDQYTGDIDKRLHAEADRAKEAEQALREEIAAVEDVAVQYSAQNKSSIEQAQARKNIGAVGVAPVSGMILLEYNGQTVYPTTNSSEVRMVDETGTYTGTLNEKLKWLEENRAGFVWKEVE